jgi:hypothetical protein
MTMLTPKVTELVRCVGRRFQPVAQTQPAVKS